MNDRVGMNTQDCLALNQPTPTEEGLTPEEQEKSTVRFGERCLAWGIGIHIFTVFTGLTTAVIADLSAFHTEAGRLFGVLAAMAAISLGTILVAFGGAERIHRNQRAINRKTITEVNANRRAIEDMANRLVIKDTAHQQAIQKLTERLDIALPCIQALPARLDAVEAVIEKVPAYSRGVIDGIQVRADSFGPDNDRN